MPGPDTLTPSPDPDLHQAYLLGVYAAQAHATHRRLNPGVGVTVTDRYLRLLAAQPDRAFALMQQHLQAVMKSARGQQRWLADHLAAELAQVLMHHTARLHREKPARMARPQPPEGAAS